MRRAWIVAVVAGALVAACSDARPKAAPPTFRDDVGPLFAAKCAACHGTEGGYSVGSYLSTIGCGASGEPANAAPDAPILRALDRAPHQGLLAAEERALVERWLAAGSPAFRGAVHDPAFADPRAEGSHARFLRARSWRPMLDANDADACGRCHEGAPARPPEVKLAAPGATSCTTCHTDPKGPLACTTCHGDKDHAAPPRDACFHPKERADPTHPAHARFACSTCHPVANDFAGTHGDGRVEVWFDQNLAGVGARFDGASCATRCHAGPGAKRPKPAWRDPVKMACGDCHAAPPAGHYEGACASCHQEGPSLHVNGRVDLGDGSGKCGACHGTGDDPLPKTGAHALHANPKNAQPVACTTCHELPSGKHPRGGGATVRLIGRAATGGLAPRYDATTKTCSNVYCHAVGGGTTPKPTWTGTLSGCNGCHGLPPSAPHTTNASCGTASCHEGKVLGGVLTADGVAHHVNGAIELR